MSLRRFFRLLLDKDWQPPVPTVDDSLAKTVKDAMGMRGGGTAWGAAQPLVRYQWLVRTYRRGPRELRQVVQEERQLASPDFPRVGGSGV